ncbi:MAG: RHS repeat-associated core domain-containing protein [Candidatus Methylomirabilales bacterium]
MERSSTRPSRAFRGPRSSRTPTGHGRCSSKTARLFEAAIGALFQLKAIADRNGNTITILRDSLGRPVTLIEPGGRSLQISYATNILISSVRDPLGREVSYGYDANSRLTTVTDPAGGVTTYTYDANGRLLTITDPRQITFLTNEYGTSGRVLKQVQADGGEWRLAYQLSGAQVTGPGCPGPTCPDIESLENIQQGFTFTGGFVLATTVTDPRGNSTTNRFNNFGYTIEQIDALGQSTKFEREFGSNLLLSVTDPLGRKAVFEYDTAGNVTRLIDPFGAVTEYQYDPTLNLPVLGTNTVGQSSTYTYDAAGNLTTVTDPQGRVTTFTYDTQGQLTQITDFAARTSFFEYNAQGDLVAVTNALGVRITNITDIMSRVIETTDGNGRITRYAYDVLDRPISAVGSLGNVALMNYDANSNLIEVVDPRGQRFGWEYDAMGHVTAMIDPAGQREVFGYDLAGNLVSAVNRRGQSATLEYDTLNRLRRISLADGSSIEYSYDATGNLVAAQDSIGGTITRTHDALGRLLTEATPQGTVTYSYDLLGRRTQILVSGEAPVSYQYDTQGLLSQVQQNGLIVGLEYDTLGRRTGLSFSNGVSTAYQYDAASRLTALTHQLPTGLFQDLRFTYDGRGNRTGVSGRAAGILLPAAVIVSPANILNQYTSFGTQSLTYDEDGNLTGLTDSSGTTTFTWDPRGQLSAISGPGLSASFAYDAFGRRVRKTVNGVTSEFLYDGIDIMRELRDGVPITYLRGLDVDEVWARTETGETQFYLTDEVGSPAALTNAAGFIRTQYAYSPFGITQTLGDPSANAFQFTGRENDGTGLYYFRNRYYSPALGRFISEDPVGFLGGGNFYAYVGNNPCTFVDPLGLGPCGIGRFTKALVTKAGRSFSADDLNNGLALVYAEATPNYRTDFVRRVLDEESNDLVQTEITEEDRVNEAHGISSTMFNRLGRPGFNFVRDPRGMAIALPIPQTLRQVTFARAGKFPQFAAAGDENFMQALELATRGGDPAGVDCNRYARAYRAVRDTVLNGPRFDFDMFRGVFQKGGVRRRLDLFRGQTNFAATDFWNSR